MFYCLLDLRSGECNVVSLYVLCFSVNGSVCFVCCVFDSVCELFGEVVGGWLGPGSGRVGCCHVCVCCESGLFVLMAGPGNCILC